MRKPLLLQACLLAMSALVLTSIQAQKTPVQIAELKQKILSDSKIASIEISAERQTPSLITFKNDAGVYTKASAAAVLNNILNVRTGTDGLVEAMQLPHKNGFETIIYQQYFKGIKVDHAGYKVLVKDGNIVLFNGSWFDVPATVSKQPFLPEAQALASAKATVGARKYAWENIQEQLLQTTDLRKKAGLQKELDEYLPKGELVFVEDNSKDGVAEIRLAYKFNIYAAEPLSRAWIYVDAQNGKILLVDKIIKHADDPGKGTKPLPSVNTTVKTRYAGSQQIKTKQISGNDPNSGLPLLSSHPTTGSDIGYIPGSATYVLIDDTRGGGIETYDLNGVGGAPVSLAPAYTQAKSFTDVDNNWDSTEHATGGGYTGPQEALNDDIAWDAHWGAEVVYDYWLAKHNRKSYDGNDAKIKSYIHYGPAYDNAFWNGTAMTYGDGSFPAPGGFKALTSLDVCGHEIGHGVCSFTADLLYEKESGAMNEGFSDIWAACIEHFSMVRSGTTVPFNKYRPFYIGEQISANPASPLRRMDNPKAQSNPDTYKGANWENANCAPNLANDQCGVHTNSGVLNHWFFLLTAGSKFGTRPAGINSVAYYFADSDDELKDDTTVLGVVLPNSVPYRVNGVGFDVSEQIAFITETMLTSGATYAEARAVSIEVAKAYAGDPCGSVVKSVQDAWFAVGVGTAFPATCTVTYGLVSTATQEVTETGTSGTVCNEVRTITLPVFAAPLSTIMVSTSGTATLGKDYTLSTTTLQNSTGSNQSQNIVVTINDDAVVDRTDGQPETIILTLSGVGLTNTSITLKIMDDDVLPRLGSDSITLVNENFNGSPNNFTEPTGWAEKKEITPDYGDPLQGAGHNQWAWFNNRISVSDSAAIAAMASSPTYNTNSGSQTIIYKQQAVDARGLNGLFVKFDYTVGGEVDPAGTDPETFPKLDYMELVYSEDNGASWQTFLGDRYRFASFPAPATATFADSLPAYMANKQFLLGFRWVNDPLLGNAYSTTIDNLTLKAVPTKIESELGDQSKERMVQNEDAYYYSTRDRGLIAKLRQAGTFDYGCMTATITKAGSGTFNLYSDGINSNRVVNKFISINPTTNNASGTYTVTLYLSEAEIVALEQVSGTMRQQFSIYKTANDYTQAGNGNTQRLPAAYLPITVNSTTIGGEFTATFNTGFSGFAVGVQASIVLPVNCLDFKAAKGTNDVTLNWKTGNDAAGTIYEVERSTNGSSYETIASQNGNSSSAYNFTDRSISSLRAAYYRIKATDAGGASRYLCTVLYVSFDGRNALTIGNIYPNPGKGEAIVNVTLGEPRRLRIEYSNAAGQIIQVQPQTLTAGASRVQLNVQALAAGSYLIRFRDEEGRVINAQQFIKQ